MGTAIVWLVDAIVTLLIYMIVASAILSWLFAFDVINHRNRFVNQLASFLDSVTAPLMAPFRRVIPPLGGIDITPIVVLLLLNFARIIFMQTLAGPLIATLG
jgi:YggT family protein